MNKLELRQILPYVAYGVKGIFTILGNRPFAIDGFSIEDDEVIVRGYPGAYGGHSDSIENFKPLLIPLDQLTDEIANEYKIFGRVHTLFNGEIVNTATAKDFLKMGIKNGSIKYSIMSDLISKHYDVFDLIGQGLALNKLEVK